MLKLRSFASICFFALVIPLLGVILILFQYTVHQTVTRYQIQTHNMVTAIVSSVEDQIEQANTHLHEGSQSMEFLHISYAQSRERLFRYASQLDQRLATKFSGIPMFRGFFFYNSHTDYLYSDFNGDVSSSFQKQIRCLLGRYSAKIEKEIKLVVWEDGFGLALIFRLQKGAIAAVLDPTKDPMYQANLTTMPDGLCFFPKGKEAVPNSQSINLGDYPISLWIQVPQSGFFHQLDTIQIFLLVVIIILILLLPAIWLLFYLKFYRPLQNIVAAFSIVSQGNLDYRLSGTSAIQELNQYRAGFNNMMDTIQEERANSLHWQQKSYHQQLDTMHAQLQFYQLQIRPHFYLNCLKNLYSLLDLKKYEQAEDLILSLSAYLSHIFRNIQSYISLREELDATEKYVRLCQHLDRQLHLSLSLDNDTLTCRILPMSVLTFVENSIKHGDPEHCLEISISVTTVEMSQQKFLQVTIQNNGGPFDEAVLRALNTANPSAVEYRQEHIGISNVRYRLWLMYGERAKLFFRNQGENAVVETLLPYEKSQGGSYEHFDC